MTDPPAQLRITLGTAFTLERELGGGGMSRVCLAGELAGSRKREAGSGAQGVGNMMNEAGSNG